MRLQGADHLSRKVVMGLIDLRPGDSFNRDRLDRGLDRLVDRYRSDGFLTPAVEVFSSRAAPGDEIDLLISIKEGSLSRLGRVNVTGNGLYPEERIEGLIDLKFGERIDSDRLKRSMKRLRDFYLRNGHADAKVKPADFRLDSSGRIGFDLRLDEGPRYSIGELKFDEFEHTDRDLIEKISGLTPGDTYDGRVLQEARLRLRRSGYFSDVGPIQPEPRPERELMDLRLRLEEGSAGSFGGMVGYQPTGTGQGGGFIGQIDLNVNNIAGSGKFGSVYWQRLPGGSGSLQVRGGDPYVFGRDMGLEAGIDQVVEDSLYIRRDLFVQSRVFSRGPISLLLSGRGSWTWPETESGLIDFSSSGSLGGGLAVDTRDRILEPGRGLNFFTLAEVGRSRGNGGAVRSGRLTGDLEIFCPLGRRRTFFSGLHLRRALFRGDRTPISDRFLLGGNRTIRGFRESQFRAWEAAWLNLECRIGIARNASWVPFVDLGHLRPAPPGGPIKAGYGMGMRLKTAAGTFGIDYAMSPGRSLGAGLVHLRLQEEF